MSYISLDAANNLYWIGRYLQRAETMLKEYAQSYDYVIDRDFEDGKKLFEKFGEKIEYKNSTDFFTTAVYGKHSLNIADMSAKARENAVICRNLIDDDTFAAMNAVNIALIHGRESGFWVYDTYQVLSMMRAIWGGLREPLIIPKAYSIIEFGGVVERIDVKLRLYDDLSNILFEIDNLNIIAKKLSPSWKKIKITSSDKDGLITLFNSLISDIVDEG